MKGYLFGAALGNVIGGLIGMMVLPLKWFPLFAATALVGAYIAQAIWDENSTNQHL
jgi:hypothetical protein